MLRASPDGSSLRKSLRFSGSEERLNEVFKNDILEKMNPLLECLNKIVDGFDKSQ